VVGVDEFAWKKGRRYGTILVDLEAHRVLALLPDREVGTVADWFRQYPTIRHVTRDRSGAFAEAIRLGAPQALQSADRFHLSMNASACLEAVITREHAALRQVLHDVWAADRELLPPVVPTVLYHQRESRQRQTRRQARYEQALAFAQQGWSQSAIARELGMHRDTIARYLHAGQFPERVLRTPRPKAITAYLPFLQQRWAEGEQNGHRLHQEGRALGYRGGATMGYAAIRLWRASSPCPHQTTVVKKWPTSSPHQTT
jgi:DNA-binding NarL/FixJ family response regulator